MDTEAQIKATNRRIYKRAWMARHRRKLKAEHGEEVRLFLPHRLATDLRRLKPKGVGLRQWLVVELRHKVAQTPEDAGPSSRPEAISAAVRNKPCPCGCGRKAKLCQIRA